ncbi:PLP-dependent cysteine synthase family protein [Microtetraspora sp. AC03309]|uniref:PLP-dependent cysteine synthase family protein n=1 Tax=Microtetraspora sp. AC03309 TaxID=2779376 RepID=UPI001E4CC3C9|nr:PLP-dependent cysteine synthase family protein [Microtetraspora sp. AC03309]MCC5576783.1 PLP-dependent cysteine synthase family protein [Microtetraspora sp. AC03309]
MKHVERHDPATRRWAAEAIQAVEADANRSCDTHLHVFPLPPHWGVDLYLKDESVHPTGSLKHRLARSLFLYGLANGWIGPTTTIIESSSGSTAVSEAYFARLLGLPFIAVIPASTSPEKREIIEFHGGKCHLVEDPGTIYEESRRLARETGGHYMDQFTYAERATDWRGNNNIAESIFHQMALERHPEPSWIVVSAGTGGTSATIGRYIRYRRHLTRLCVADPEGSAFYPSWVAREEQMGAGSRIEGIGRPRVEPSFMPAVIDRMTQVPDALSIAAMRWIKEVTRLDVGGSTGTNVAAAVQIIKEMRAAGERGSVVTLICDGGERYRDTYGDDQWLTRQGLDIAPHLDDLRDFLSPS